MSDAPEERPPQLPKLVKPQSAYRPAFRARINAMLVEGWEQGLRGKELSRHVRQHPRRITPPPYHYYHIWRTELIAMDELLGLRAPKPPHVRKPATQAEGQLPLLD